MIIVRGVLLSSMNVIPYEFFSVLGIAVLFIILLMKLIMLMVSNAWDNSIAIKAVRCGGLY